MWWLLGLGFAGRNLSVRVRGRPRQGNPVHPGNPVHNPGFARVENRPFDGGMTGTGAPAIVVPVKFINALLVILLISFVLGLGIWMAAHGKGAWLLILGTLGFLGLFVRYGCRTQ